jgi:hypothetical protein
MSDPAPERPPGDNPITSSAQDVLRRAPVAHGFARQVRALDANEGVVVAVLGRWGHGKTSFVNLMREEFRKDPSLVVVDFNPWLFSGTQQLVDFFFTELASSLKLSDKDKFGNIVDGLRDYGDLLSPLSAIPVVGSWWDRVFRASTTFAGALKARRDKNAGQMRDRIASALAALDAPIVVVIDDIDRLTTTEIRDVFRLVRLTASFPNLIYLLAFDRARVEHALKEGGVPGRAYLEKIVQLAFDVPSIPTQLLRTQVLAELERLLGDVGDVRFDSDRWLDVFVEIVEPLVTSLRDVTRLALSARPVIADLGGEIEVVDLIAMEAIRIFRPAIFDSLQRFRAPLTTASSTFYGRPTDEASKRQFDEVLAMAGDDADLIRNLIRRVFPAAVHFVDNRNYGASHLDRWRRAHRLADTDFLALYLDRTAPSELDAFRNAERAFALLRDGDAIDAFLGSLDPDALGDTIAGLEVYEGEFPAESVVPGATALLNHIADIPDRPRGMFDFSSPEIVVSRVVLRMLQAIPDEDAREAAVRHILEGVESLSSKYELIVLVGHIEHAGHKLVSEAAATRLEQTLVDQVEAGVAPRLDREWTLLRVYSFVKDRGATVVVGATAPPDLTRALLADAKSERRSQSVDSRHVSREAVLAWEVLTGIFGSENAIRNAVGALRAADGDSELVQLAEKYLSGWRPTER